MHQLTGKPHHPSVFAVVLAGLAWLTPARPGGPTATSAARPRRSCRGSLLGLPAALLCWLAWWSPRPRGCCVRLLETAVRGTSKPARPK